MREGAKFAARACRAFCAKNGRRYPGQCLENVNTLENMKIQMRLFSTIPYCVEKYSKAGAYCYKKFAKDY